MAEQNENLSAEQDADLRRLEGMAAETDAPGQQTDMVPAPVVDPAAEWAQIPAMLGGVLSMAFPELRAVYTHEACMTWGYSMVPVAEKYGWTQGIDKYPELTLLAVSAPMLIGTYGAFKRAKVAQEEKAEGDKEKPAAPVVAGSATAGTMDSQSKAVTIGAPVTA